MAASVQAQNLALRDIEHTPLFDIQRWAEATVRRCSTTFWCSRTTRCPRRWRGAPQELRFGEIHNQEQTNYPLTLLVHLGDELSMHFSYQCDSFAAHSVAQLAGHLQRCSAR
jgi:hypothetical protein